MVTSITPHIRSLARQVFDDPVKRFQYLSALDTHLDYLRKGGREGDGEAFLEETKADLEKDAAEILKNKSRERFRVISTFIAPAFVSIITKVVVDHMPFG